MRDWLGEVRQRREGNHADPRVTCLAEIGELAVGLEHRVHAGNEGWCIHVYAEQGGVAHEILRIDCFDREPHFHRQWSGVDEILWAEAIGDPWGWGQEVLREELTALGRWDPEIARVVARLRSDRPPA